MGAAVVRASDVELEVVVVVGQTANFFGRDEGSNCEASFEFVQLRRE